MITEGAIAAIKHHFEEIFEAENYVRIVCDKHTYRISSNQATSYTFDDYGILLTGRVYTSYQASCTFGRVYIPYEVITALTGGDI